MPPLPRSRTGGSGALAGVFEGVPAASPILPGGGVGFPSRPQLAAPRGPGHSVRRLAPHLADAFERRDTLAGDGLELVPELGRVVGDQLGAVPRPADLDIEALLGRQVRMPGFHRRDHVVHRAALEGVNGRGPGVVEVAQLRVVPAQLELPAVLQGERHPAARDRHHFRRPAVHQPQPGIVARPADAVAGAELDLLGPVDLAAASPPADLARLPCDGAAVPAFQNDLAGLVVHAGDAAFVALSTPIRYRDGGTPPRRRPHSCQQAPSRRWCSPWRPAVRSQRRAH